MSVILDPHNNECGVCHSRAAVTMQDLAALWGAIAAKYKTNPLVIFGLYNEPMNYYAQFDVPTWRTWAQTVRSGGCETGKPPCSHTTDPAAIT